MFGFTREVCSTCETIIRSYIKIQAKWQFLKSSILKQNTYSGIMGQSFRAFMVTSLKQVTLPHLPCPDPTKHLVARQLGGLCVLDSVVLVLLSGWLRIASCTYAGLCRTPGTMLVGLERENCNPYELTGGFADCKMKRDVGLELRNRKQRKESMLMLWEVR